MKGYRFYEEFDNSYKKRMKRGSGNVLALDIDPVNGRTLGHSDHRRTSEGLKPVWMLECTAAVLSEPDSPVCGTAVTIAVLRKNYRRIPEKRAREIHPAMFAFLDSFDENGEPKASYYEEDKA